MRDRLFPHPAGIADQRCARQWRGLAPGGRNKFESFGLVWSDERIVRLGGTCAVFSEPGGGTMVMVSAPVAEAPEHLLQNHQEYNVGSAVT